MLGRTAPPPAEQLESIAHTGTKRGDHAYRRYRSCQGVAWAVPADPGGGPAGATAGGAAGLVPAACRA